ncbi:ankyrin repeat-containing domain protein [Tirmania nivea]|nr:ankyrin repeat-containing domain protein [Tirmania nivea]
MSDPLSVTSAVFGLVAISTQLGVLSKQLYDSAKDALVSMAQIQQEIDDLHLVFVEVGSFIRGTAKNGPSKRGLSMISLHYLLIILTGCILLFSKLEKKLNEVAGLMNPITKKPARGLQCTVDRIKWALWKEGEVAVLVRDSQRHKPSLQLMLSMIQWYYPCFQPRTVALDIPIVKQNTNKFSNTTSEANEPLEKLHELVEKILESNIETSIQLRALISRQSNEPPAHQATASEHNLTSVLFQLEFFGSLVNIRDFRFGATDLATSTEKTHGIHAERRRVLPWPSRGRIHTAIKTNNDFVLRTLITLGADLEEKDSEGYTPLIIAICNRSSGICRTLLEIGAEVDTRTSGITPVIHAITFHDDDPDEFAYINLRLRLWLCKLLVDAGAAVDIPDSSGRSPLSYAAAHHPGLGPGDCPTTGPFPASELLIDKRAAADTPDTIGRTPLSYAAESNLWSNLGLLVDIGAAVNTPDLSGRTPLSFAAATSAPDSIWGPYTEYKGKVPPISDQTSTLTDNSIPVCTLLLDKGARVNTYDGPGHSPSWYYP